MTHVLIIAAGVLFLVPKGGNEFHTKVGKDSLFCEQY